MADPQFTVARSGGANAGTLNITENIIRALTRIAVKVREEVGADAAREALTLGFDQIDTEDPSVSDLEDLAEQVGVDISDLLGGDDGAGSGDGAGDDAAAASANGSASLTANTRRVAEAFGLPTDWHALEGIDLPPSLADAVLDDRGLAAAINTAQGWDPAEGEGVPPRRVANVRDKDLGGAPGVSASALNDDDAGTTPDLDAEPPLPVSTVRQRVERHNQETGRSAGLNSRDGFGVGIDDLDGE